MNVLLVDGYNVIGASPIYSHLREVDMDAARAALISDVAAFAQRTWRATVVFDGAGNPASEGRPDRVAGIDVVFSPAGVEADAVIESLARAAREREDTVLVVTSDAATQWTVMGGGVERMSSAAFSEELGAARESWEASNPSGPRKATLGERIDPAVADRLSRWAREGGEGR